MNHAMGRIVDCLVDNGMPRENATLLVQRAAARVEAAGLGEETSLPENVSFIPTVARDAIEQARQTVSPWLWVMSVAGFIMAVVNTRRIGKMFGSWKRARVESMRIRRRSA